ncbi:MAG: rhomboid family intramembrane serine protease, partial [Chloroflexi bacterium]
DWLIFRGALDRFGIQPRTLIGLRGIILGPFLHGSFRHLATNTIPFVVLGWLVMVRGLGRFVMVSVITAVISGLGTWLLGGSGSTHIGVSGLIFGYFGYILLSGYFERTFSAIIWAVVVFLAYGGIIFGILPQGNGISWQMHLFGLLGGALAAYLLSEKNNRQLI